MTGASEWQGRVGAAWADEWRRTDRSLAPVNAALVAAAAPFGRGAILDIGCGAGATSLALADAFAGAKVTGLDLSDDLVAQARIRAGDRASPRFEVGDAARWQPDDGAVFDLIVSRHGVMFFEDPVAAFGHLRMLAAPGGRLLFSCFRAREDNEWVAAMAPIVARYAPESLGAAEPATGPFAFADPDRIRAILALAGFAPPDVAPLDFAFVVGEGADPLGEALHFFSRIGPIARVLSALDPPARSQAKAEMAEILSARRTEGCLAFRGAAWIVTSEVKEAP